MQKNERLRLPCMRLGSELEGICISEGMPVFVPGALPGENADVLIVKTQPKYAFGRLMGVESPSPDRTEPFCPVYDKCGGCSGQHMTYEAGLKAKREQVLDCLRRIGGLNIADENVLPVLGAEQPLHCRNKTSLPVSGTCTAPQLGFYRRRSHDIVPLDDCPISMGPLKGVADAVKEWIRAAKVQPYNELTGKGLLRHVVTRVSRSGELMVTLSASGNRLPDIPLLIHLLQEKVPGFCALHLSVQPNNTNVILGDNSRCLWGREAITETLLGLEFEIPPLSFFQVNPFQTEKLYRCAIDMADPGENDLVVDAYCGAGTISLCLAKRAGKVIGIEIVPQAIEGARCNAERNGITNAEFYTDAVEKRLPLLVEAGLRPDIVVLDPPRKGVEPQVIEAVIKAAPKKVVYVSCHVPTQARDAALLCAGGYTLRQCRPVDLFCWSGGVENVALLTRNE